MVYGCHTELQCQMMLCVRCSTYQIGGEGRLGVRASVHVGEDTPGRMGKDGAKVH